MNILIKQHNEILIEMKKSEKLLENKNMSEIIIQKIAILNDKLLDISSSLNKLNIALKLDNKIELTEKEKDYIDHDKKSNKLIAEILPALTILSLSENRNFK